MADRTDIFETIVPGPSAVRPATPAAMAGSLVFLALLAVLALAPLWFGSNRPFAWNLNALVLGLLVFGATVALTIDRAPAPRLGSAVVPAALSAVALGWVALQALPGMPAILGNDAWILAEEALGRPLANSISIAPDLTIQSLLRLLTDAAGCWLAFLLVASRDRAHLLVQTIAVAAGVYALYGLVVLALGSPMVLWIEKTAYRSDATGPFLNRNTFATFLAIGLVAAVDMVWTRFRLWREGEAGIGLIVGGMTVAVLIGLALALSHSRAGVAVGVAGLAAYMLLRLVGGRSSIAQRIVAGLFAGAIVMAGIVGLAVVSSRRATGLDEDWEARLAVYRMTWQAAVEHLWTGIGAGTFELFFATVRTDEIRQTQTWDKAHNTYLEAILTLGLPAALMLTVAIVWIVVLCLRGAFVDKRDRSAQRVAVAAVLVVGLHSLVDFSLQIQAVSLIVFALLGAGLRRTREEPGASTGQA